MEKHWVRCWGGLILIYLIMSSFLGIKQSVFSIRHKPTVREFS